MGDSKGSFGTKINNAGISNAGNNNAWISSAWISNAGFIFIKFLVYCLPPHLVFG